ncbi:hypothetical protein HanXRQr2_Chr08g0341551 [Helianthus annuus]|uniref:Uncharacterized protein n=1 Tax=Helianthus annuus TaxID=4232 RepID=A0A9K3IG03_HELAN|nr:hypothetical protein HanXRQr2_Chr08g0341551 [Helianthus annuus]KAJ0901839.1 hypothetical protein HanPSC8_Chr08g0329951 [Helianthus annuus]
MLRSSPGKDHKKRSPLKSQGIIKDSAKERYCFTDPQIDRIRHCFPANAVFKPFDPTYLSDHASETWIAFPFTPFTIGYTYPFPAFTQSFFSLTGISFIQAMPMVWRVLITLERIIEQHGIDLGMSELSEMYDLVSHGSHRYLLKRKPGEEHPIFKATKNDTNWKWRFFFVRRDSIPDGKDLPRKWTTHAISVSHLFKTPTTRERLLAFRRLNPAVRSFKTSTQDSQEVSSGSVTMSSAGKSSKSASKFSIADLDTVRSSKKKATASPTVSIPKAPTKGRGGKKRKTSEAEDLQGLPLIRHQFLEYFIDKFAEIEDYVGSVEELEKKYADLQQVAVLKDHKIADLQKALQDAKTEMAKVLINTDYEKYELMEGAKVSAAITMCKTKLKMAQEAQDPDFDRSNWDVEGWKARLAELEDEYEAEEVLAIEAGGSGKDHGGEASGAAEDDAAKV